jgi:FkbM family methyltransferase
MRHSLIDSALRAFGRMAFVHPGVRFRLIRAARTLLRVGDREFTEPFFGATYPGHTGIYIDSFVYYVGGYERGALELFKALAMSEPGFVFCDVGANVGHHTLFMSQLCEVLAFEPNPDLVATLEHKLRLNGVRNVRTFTVGLGSATADLEYFQPITANTGTGSFVAGFHQSNAASGKTLKVVQGDEFLGAQGVARIDLLKIDVEGFEHEVLKGIPATLDAMSPTIFLEVSRNLLQDAGSLEGFLALFPSGYKAFGISNVFHEHVRLMPFDFDRPADKNVLLVRRPEHEAVLKAQGFLN